ncbi:MAG: T9SS type A sorting domain-containing protein, partial [Ignavibacteriaceae bacterium]|nr:T9SS type A sorting domain-containing protein [Ignavibacteriaceae bacterium]
HTVNFNASDLNSGVYLYKFETNGIIQSRKMILAK